MKFGYELNVNNEVWAGIHIIIGALREDEHVNSFAEQFDNDSCKQAQCFEVKNKEFLLQITIDENALRFLLRTNENNSTFYEVNFNNPDEIEEEEDLEHFEELHEQFISFLESEHSVYTTKLELVS